MSPRFGARRRHELKTFDRGASGSPAQHGLSILRRRRSFPGYSRRSPWSTTAQLSLLTSLPSLAPSPPARITASFNRSSVSVLWGDRVADEFQGRSGSREECAPPGGGHSSVLIAEHSEVELADPLGVGEEVELDDLSVLDRDGGAPGRLSLRGRSACLVVQR